MGCKETSQLAGIYPLLNHHQSAETRFSRNYQLKVALNLYVVCIKIIFKDTLGININQCNHRLEERIIGVIF